MIHPNITFSSLLFHFCLRPLCLLYDFSYALNSIKPLSYHPVPSFLPTLLNVTMARGKQKRIKPVAGAQTDQNSSHFLTQMPVVINPRIMPIIETDETLNVKPETMPNMKLKVESVVEPGIKSETKPGGKHGAGPATEQASKLKPKRKKKKKFNVVQAWQTYWGKGELTDWQRLCGDLGADGDLSSKDKCKEVCSPFQ